MKRLIIVRHGDFDYTDTPSLSSRGREQIISLAHKLKTTLQSERIVILTSVADRARESAEILGKAFGVGIEEHKVLWSDGTHPEDLEETLKLVRSQKDADILILVTHLEYTEKFPAYFAENELGLGSFPSREVYKGHAWDINCVQKTIAHIKPS